MDHIYPTKDYKEYVIKEEVEKLRQIVKTGDMPKSFDEIALVLEITEEQLKQKTLDLCKIYEDYGDEKPSNAEGTFEVFSEEALELNCLKYLRKNVPQFKTIRNKERPYVKSTLQNAEEPKNDIEMFKECVITLRFYEPFKYTPSIKNQPRFHQEYQVLGSNFLSELKDKFYCQCNFGPFFDISDNPNEEKVHDPTLPNPAFFYIHDTFYNDTRNPDNPDYSDVIIKWAKKLKYARDFKNVSMEQTKFEDLKVRIGYPCVYQHHGACEHIFCITSVDLIDNSDSLLRSDYPKITALSKRRPILCEVCNQVDAAFLVTNCALHVKDPLRLCDTCFFSFHYIDREIKTCEFKAYRLYSINPDSLKSLEHGQSSST